MPTSIQKQLCITNNTSDREEMTIFLNDKGNVFIQEGQGIEMTDFWFEVDWKDWEEVVTFINQLKKEKNV